MPGKKSLRLNCRKIDGIFVLSSYPSIQSGYTVQLFKQWLSNLIPKRMQTVPSSVPKKEENDRDTEF